MHLRPAPAHWFETYVPRHQTVTALEALAATGLVQLQPGSQPAEAVHPGSLSATVSRFQRLRDSYTDLLPAAKRSPDTQPDDNPEHRAREALDCLERWSAPLAALLEQQAQQRSERRNLMLLSECLIAMQQASLDVSDMAKQSEALYKAVFACPRARRLPPQVCANVEASVAGQEHNFFVVADEPACSERIETSYRSHACVRLQIPDWLVNDRHNPHSRLSRQLADLEARAAETRRALREKKTDSAVAAALATMDLLSWYQQHSSQLSSTRKRCRVSGWSSAPEPRALQQAFDRAGIEAVIRFAPAPQFSRPPVSLSRPWWSAPFRFMIDMLGTPDRNAIDSGKLLPFIVPLLFGYMFPDLGHGLVLVLFSAVLYRRWPAGRFLMPCGFSAMLFGLVFGEVFGLEQVIDPLWVRPLEQPLLVLLTPLAFGAGLILLGLAFDGVQALWRGEARNWLLRDASVVLLYGAGATALLVPQALWLAVFALLWFVSGHWLVARPRRLTRLASGAGLLLHISFELAMNTLSFLRVGAFALAHAALSTAILGLTEGVSNPVLHTVLLIMGHIFIISIEGLVAFVQTTRLVLFEFFVRFLRAEGRPFRPMSKPPQS